MVSVEDINTQWALLTEWLSSLLSFIGLSSLVDTVSINSTYLHESAKLLILGSVIEAGRRLSQWLMERFKFHYFLSARFDEGDPAYDWLVLFLTEEKVWKKSRDFIVTARSSKRNWAVRSGPGAMVQGNADYIPNFGAPQLFRWSGYWVEITRSKDSHITSYGSHKSSESLQLIIYTREMTVLSALVEEARLRYNETGRKNVTIHSADSPQYGPGRVWTSVKAKVRRPLNSLILEEGFFEALIGDANDFLDMEEWYVQDAGIPHRRGYLLYGPPGTGKTSTVYTVAGELGLEIYSLSLASNFIDDSFLQRAISTIPKHGLLLIEDIDCAFPSREEAELDEPMYNSVAPRPFSTSLRSGVTLSGLLNMIDGVNSENGKLFFATTNHIDRLDPALLRPGRIDKKFQYKLATRKQAWALYRRFFPESRFAGVVAEVECGDRTNHNLRYDPTSPDKSVHYNDETEENPSRLSELANQFAESVPDDEFSTAELQGYLLTCKMKPLDAVSGIAKWIEQERTEKRERVEREEKRKEELRKTRLKAKTAIFEDLVGPLQQQAASSDASCSSGAASHGIASNSTREPVTPPQTAVM